MPFLTMQNDFILFICPEYGEIELRTFEQFESAMIGYDGFNCSSSIDFPQDYSDKQSIIELARKIRP